MKLSCHGLLALSSSSGEAAALVEGNQEQAKELLNGKEKVFINIKPGGRTTSHDHGNDGPQQWLKRKEPKLALKPFTIDVEPDLHRGSRPTALTSTSTWPTG